MHQLLHTHHIRRTLGGRLLGTLRSILGLPPTCKSGGAARQVLTTTDSTPAELGGLLLYQLILHAAWAAGDWAPYLQAPQHPSLPSPVETPRLLWLCIVVSRGHYCCLRNIFARQCRQDRNVVATEVSDHDHFYGFLASDEEWCTVVLHPVLNVQGLARCISKPRCGCCVISNGFSSYFLVSMHQRMP